MIDAKVKKGWHSKNKKEAKINYKLYASKVIFKFLMLFVGQAEIGWNVMKKSRTFLLEKKP